MITIPLALLILHTLGDFFLQSDWMAINKSKRLSPLVQHCTVYACCFVAYGLEFMFITFALHLLVDAITSRITSKLWFIETLTRPTRDGVPMDGYTDFPMFARLLPGRRHWFFVMLGVDQLCHFICLALTYHRLFS